ncbi:MAG: hypothetical protein AB7E49_03705 [Campylobacterales bacterium]
MTARYLSVLLFFVIPLFAADSNDINITKYGTFPYGLTKDFWSGRKWTAVSTVEHQNYCDALSQSIETKGVEIIRPALEVEGYDHPKLKEALGPCWWMRLDYKEPDTFIHDEKKNTWETVSVFSPSAKCLTCKKPTYENWRDEMGDGFLAKGGFKLYAFEGDGNTSNGDELVLINEVSMAFFDWRYVEEGVDGGWRYKPSAFALVTRKQFCRQGLDGLGSHEPKWATHMEDIGLAKEIPNFEAWISHRYLESYSVFAQRNPYHLEQPLDNAMGGLFYPGIAKIDGRYYLFRAKQSFSIDKTKYWSGRGESGLSATNIRNIRIQDFLFNNNEQFACSASFGWKVRDKENTTNPQGVN